MEVPATRAGAQPEHRAGNDVEVVREVLPAHAGLRADNNLRPELIAQDLSHADNGGLVVDDGWSSSSELEGVIGTRHGDYLRDVSLDEPGELGPDRAVQRSHRPCQGGLGGDDIGGVASVDRSEHEHHRHA